MKHVHFYALLLMSVFFTSCGQNQTGLSQDNIKSEIKDSITPQKCKDNLAQACLPNAEISKEIESGSIYESTSPYHNVLHEFTYLVAMRDFCNKNLSQMCANSEVDKKFSQELETELLNTKARLTSSQFDGLKIEPGLYEVFLKQINDRCKDLSLNQTSGFISSSAWVYPSTKPAACSPIGSCQKKCMTEKL